MSNSKQGKGKKVILKALRLVICIAFSFLFLLIVSSSVLFSDPKPEQTVEVFGKSFAADEEALAFSGDEIGGAEEIVDKIDDFDHLGFVDLGSYSVELKDADKIRAEFSDVDVNFRTHVTLYGKKVDTDAMDVDLTGLGLSNVSELTEKLPDLPNISRVLCKDSTVSLDDKKMLIRSFPNVEFDIRSFVRVCGKDAEENTVDLDLTGCTVDSSILDQLKQLASLKSVDLHGVAMTTDFEHELVAAFPNVKFVWDVELGGEKYESDVEDLDLTGKRGLTLDAIREAIPQFCHLKRLDLSDCGFANETLAAFREEFPDTKIVWRIYMGRWALKTDAVAFSVLIYTYDYKRLTSADIQVLKYCTDLQALDLGHQALTDLSVIGDYLPELRILILADNTVRDLTPIAKLKHLHYLELFVNPFLSDLTPIGACKEMVDLNISHLYTVSDISMLLDFPQLERLWIEHTAVSAADIQLLRNTYPNATVVNIGYGSVDQGWRAHPRYFAMIDMYHDTTFISEEFSKYDVAD